MRSISAWTVAGVAVAAGAVVGGGTAAIESALRPWRVGDFSSSAPDSSAPRADVPATHHSFGTVGSGEKGRHTFTVRNTGDGPLVLSRGSTSCTCTVSDFGPTAGESAGDAQPPSTKTVAPGESTTVSIQWTGKGTGGPFRQQATVLTNDPRRPEIAFVIEGTVTPTWKAVPDLLTLPKLSVQSDETFTTTVFTYGSEAARVESLAAVDDRTKAFFSVASRPLESAVIAAEPGATGGFLLEVNVKPGLPIGPLRQTVRMVLRMPEEITAEIPIEGSVAGDLSFAGPMWNADRQRLMLGTLSSRAGLKTKIFITARGPHRHRVNAVVREVVPTSLDVRIGDPEPIGNGTVVRIPIGVEIPAGSPTANHLGSEQAPAGRIVLETGLPDSPTVTLPVSVVIGP